MVAEKIVLLFVDAINHADITRLASLMTDNHVFIDSDGSNVRGKDAVVDGWSRYFSIVTDYSVTVHEIFSNENTTVLVGVATGAFARSGKSHPSNRFSVPAAWRAVVDLDAGKVAVWQVFVNPEPMIAAMQG